MLIALLKSDDQEICAKAALAVSRLARSHPSNQVSIANAGGIQVLVSMVSLEAQAETPMLLRTGSSVVTAGLGDDAEKVLPAEVVNANRKIDIRVNLQKEASSALWSMAYENKENQKAIADEGGIPSLISLLSYQRSEVHRDSAGALWALSASTENQILIADSEGIKPLVALLQGSESGSQETAAGALHVLAELPANRKAIAEAGGVPALTALFKTGSEETKIEVAGVLSNMVLDNPENQSSVAQSLVRLLGDPASSTGAQEHVTQLLYHLALDPENRGALSKWGAIPQLATQLKEGTPSSQHNAAAGLSQIALKSPQHRVQVTAQLIILLGDEKPDVRQRGFAALQDMAAEGGSDSRMTVKMAGGIDRFVALLKDGSLEAQEYALWLLWQSTDPASKKSIAMARCARPIVAILVSDDLKEKDQKRMSALCKRTRRFRDCRDDMG